MTFKDNLIVDVGMHSGQDTAFYLKKGFDVVAIDANPLLCSEASRRFAREIGEGRLLILNVGISESSAELDFYVNDTHSEWSSLIPNIGSRTGKFHIIKVPTVPLANVLSEQGVPRYVKIDIEGSDMVALRSILTAGLIPPYVSLENGVQSAIDFLITHGYTNFKFINQATVREIKLPRPPREGRWVEHAFPFGASGPFGEETEGPWQNREEISRVVKAYWSTPNLDAEKHGWFDLHARHGSVQP